MIAVALIVLVLLLALSVPVAGAIGTTGLILAELYSTLPLHRSLGYQAWSVATSFITAAIPMYILIGQLMLKSGIAERMYGALRLWISWLPGGLMHTNIAASAMFAATSGSSAATAATIGTVSLDEMTRLKYNERLFLGSIAAGGTLGILIPPSSNMIIVAVLTNTSIPQLYLAGIVPGIVLSLLFSATIFVACRARPSWGGERISSTWSARIRSLPDLAPPILIFGIVIGSIYAGIATPTESAALGVVFVFALLALRRRFTWDIVRDSLEGTMRVTAMIIAVLVAAYFFNLVIAGIGLTNRVMDAFLDLGLSPLGTILVVVLFCFVLGMFMETMAMMIATVPLLTPVVVALGYDPVWFGVLVMLMLETAMITPPVGINLFVVQGVRKGGDMRDVMVGSLPFVVPLLLMMFLLILFPQLALWLARF
jgi:C4-dicarboxylate transporter, DctM subunit